MKSKKELQLARIVGFGHNVVSEGFMKRLTGKVCAVEGWLDSKHPQPEPYRSAKLYLFDQNLTIIVSQVELELLDVAEELERGTVCACIGRKDLHLPGPLSTGCLSEAKPPFCAACGQPCYVITNSWTEVHEIQGSKHYVPESENVSECCNSCDLTQDCNLTQPWEKHHG